MIGEGVLARRGRIGSASIGGVLDEAMRPRRSGIAEAGRRGGAGGGRADWRREQASGTVEASQRPSVIGVLAF